jgi:flagellar M-ring protein FliF
MAELQPTANATTPPTGASVLYQNLSAMPVVKQVSLIIALAATIAIGVALVLWSQAPNYALLFGGLDNRQAADIVKALDAQAIPYQYDTNTGSLTVPATKVHELRLKLAAEGLPKSAETGYQILDKDQGFGVSQFKENVQYIRALEGELAQSVAAIAAVKSARVHLAIPKRTVFVRKEQETTASVVVNLHGSLSEAQVNAIMHLVASSVPNMKAANVSVVDQSGNLLSQQSPNLGMNMSLKQLEYTRNIEQTLSARIQDLLSPLVGSKGVRAQVTAEVDFTIQEQTRENFNPDPEAVRSSQEVRERNKAAGPEGIPGALTNQPPQAGIAPEENYPGKDKNSGLAKDLQSEKVTKNYEIDRTITHSQSQVGSLKRLSVAVVVDDRVKANEDGALQRVPLTDEELARFKNLVRDAVGVDEARGDNLSLVNISFQSEVEDDISLPIWQQAWFWDVMKQAAGGLAVLLIIFGVLRPLLRDLTGVKERAKLAEDLPDEDEEESTQLAARQTGQNAKLAGGNAAIAGTLNALDEQQQEQLAELEKDDIDLVAHIRTQIDADPKVAAKVLREWMSDKG